MVFFNIIKEKEDVIPVDDLEKRSETQKADYIAKEIKELSYKIYLSVLDNENNEVFPAYKDNILQCLKFLNFPKSLIDNVAFVIIYPRFEDKFEGKLLLISNKAYRLPKFPEGKLAGLTFSPNNYKLIMLKSEVFPSKFHAILTHELGHLIAKQITSEDWIDWKEMRGEPVVLAGGKKWPDGYLSREEDFAEVYKYLFGDHEGDQDEWEIHTAYKTRPCRSYYTEEQLRRLDSSLWYKISQPDCYKNEPPQKEEMDFIKKLLSQFKN